MITYWSLCACIRATPLISKKAELRENYEKSNATIRGFIPQDIKFQCLKYVYVFVTDNPIKFNILKRIGNTLLDPSVALGSSKAISTCGERPELLFELLCASQKP